VGSRTVDIYVPRGITCPVIMSDVMSFFSSAWQCDRMEIVVGCVFDVHANNYVVWELAVLWGLSREFHSLIQLSHWQPLFIGRRDTSTVVTTQRKGLLES
jgi:hypothetical protein